MISYEFFGGIEFVCRELWSELLFDVFYDGEPLVLDLGEDSTEFMICEGESDGC